LACRRLNTKCRTFVYAVEVSKMGKAKWVGSAAAGVVAGIAATVTVYEGFVEAATSGGKVQLAAGEEATLRIDAPPSVSSSRTVALAPTAADPAVARERARKEEEQRFHEALAEAQLEPQLRTQIVRLREQVDTLREENRELREEVEEDEIYDLGESTLRKLAEECELRWDYAGVNPSSPEQISDERLEELELGEAEREVINEVLQNYTDEMMEWARGLYTEVTGDPNTSGLSFGALLAEVRDKTPETELQTIYKILSYERAGYLEAPADLSTRSATERLYRRWTSAGDRLESMLAEELGVDAAKRIRGINDGFGNKLRGSHGCPE
ncbi:MAG: hypothetical protein AAFQ82_14705, partial [Myxococcota bacterium]